MRGLIIIPSVRELKHWHKYEENAQENNFDLNDIEVLIIDENPKNRKINDKILENVNHSFYGVEERIKWLNDRNLPIDIIPLQCHAETSFGLLYAYKKDYDYIIFMDDDTAPTKDNYFGEHVNQLFNKTEKLLIESENRWFNLINDTNYFPRGFPYSERKKLYIKQTQFIRANSIMNQGLWCNQLDLNATDILPNTNGLITPVKYLDRGFHNAVLNEGNYITICSMNLSFKPDIIPAFYQLPMNEYGIDRFDDIFSGIIIKRITDHLGEYISNGFPICNHFKESRDTLKDLIVEAKGLRVNEELWKIVDNIELKEKNYKDCYFEISQIFWENKQFNGYINFLGKKMKQWIESLDKL